MTYFVGGIVDGEQSNAELDAVRHESPDFRVMISATCDCGCGRRLASVYEPTPYFVAPARPLAEVLVATGVDREWAIGRARELMGC